MNKYIFILLAIVFFACKSKGVEVEITSVVPKVSAFKQDLVELYLPFEKGEKYKVKHKDPTIIRLDLEQDVSFSFGDVYAPNAIKSALGQSATTETVKKNLESLTLPENFQVEDKILSTQKIEQAIKKMNMDTGSVFIYSTTSEKENLTLNGYTYKIHKNVQDIRKIIEKKSISNFEKGKLNKFLILFDIKTETYTQSEPQPLSEKFDKSHFLRITQDYFNQIANDKQGKKDKDELINEFISQYCQSRDILVLTVSNRDGSQRDTHKISDYLDQIQLLKNADEVTDLEIEGNKITKISVKLKRSNP